MEQTVSSIADSVREMMENVGNNVTLETTSAMVTSVTIQLKQFFLSEVLSTVVLVVSIIGILTNALVLAVLILAHREYGSNANTLIANQCAIDLFTFLSIVITRVVIHSLGILYRGNQTVDDIICVTVGTSLFASVGIMAEKTGLVVITLERYFKIVHAVAHRKYYKSWMTKVGVALPWISAACFYLFPEIGTTRVVNGRCLRRAVWPTPGMAKVK